MPGRRISNIVARLFGWLEKGHAAGPIPLRAGQERSGRRQEEASPPGAACGAYAQRGLGHCIVSSQGAAEGLPLAVVIGGLGGDRQGLA